MTLLTCSDCGRRSRFSLCSVCFTRQTEPPSVFEALTGPSLSKLYIASKERSEYFDLMTRDLWHAMHASALEKVSDESV